MGQVNQQMQQPELSNNALNAFMSAANNYPTRTPPNMLTKIGAAMAGFGGPNGLKESDYLLNNKYDQQVQDYQNKLKPLEFAANEEGQRNQTARLLAYNKQQNELNQNKLDETNRHNQETEATAKAKAETAQQIADVRSLLANRPNFAPLDSAGHVVLYDKTTGQTVDTGIESNKLTDFQKLQMGLKNSLQEIEARGEEARKTEADKQVNRKELKSIPNASSSGKTQSYSDKLNQRKLNILEAMDKFPDLSQYVTKNGADYVIPPLTGGMLSWFSSKTPEERQKIVDLIYPNDPQAQSLVRNKTETTSKTTKTRDDAIAYLKANNKPTTDANIKYLLGIGGW
jgi:hypothetical protein